MLFTVPQSVCDRVGTRCIDGRMWPSSPAEAAIHPSVPSKGIVGVIWSKIWPENIGEEELRIRKVPQEKVRHPLLPPGPNDEIWVGHARGAKILPKRILVNVLRRELPALNHLCHSSARTDDVCASTVVYRDTQRYVGSGWSYGGGEPSCVIM